MVTIETEEEKRAREERERKEAGQQFIREREKRAAAIAATDVPTRGEVEQAAREISAGEPGAGGLPGPQRTVGETIEAREELERVAEREKVFEEPAIVPIIPPEQENLSVIARIASSIIPKITQDIFPPYTAIKNIKQLEKTVIPQVEITMIAADLQDAVIAESAVQIDTRITEAGATLTEIGLLPVTRPPVTKQVGVGGVVVAGAVGGIVGAPIKEFVGTDGQIRSLELALSQYNEMVTLPARGIDSGLEPQAAFDMLSRMEEDLLALESQLKISGLTSVKVALALKGRGVEARVLKLKNKITEGRRIIYYRMVQEGFGEVEVSESIRFLRRLQNEGKGT